MNSRFARVLSPLLTPAGLLVMVVILGLSFVAIVLVPGLELASEVAESSHGAQARWASNSAIPPSSAPRSNPCTTVWAPAAIFKSPWTSCGPRQQARRRRCTR